MTISAKIHYALHEGGTKFYRVVYFERSDGTSLVVFNYGKNGTIGQIDVQKASENTAYTKIREKSRHGYTFTPSYIPVCVLQDSGLPHLMWVRQEIREFFAGDNISADVTLTVTTPEPAQKERVDPLWGSW